MKKIKTILLSVFLILVISITGMLSGLGNMQYVQAASLGSGISHQSQFSSASKTYGIDVSYHNGSIDWDAVKDSGVEFVMIRVGYRAYKSGSIGKDSKFETYYEGAKNAGLMVGVYFYSQALTTSEAEEEAQYVLDQISGKTIDFPVVMDYEFISGGRLLNANLDKQTMTDNANAFLAKVESAGYQGMLYANKTFLNNYIYASQISNNYLIWLANYTTSTSYSGDFTMWQYTQSGTLDGVSGTFDIDVWYGAVGSAAVTNGTYKLVSALDSNKVVDVASGSTDDGANVQLYSWNGTAAQQWVISYLGDGYYQIINANSGKSLDITSNKKSNGANVQQYSWNASNAQKWVLKYNGDGTYTIVSASSGKALDVTSGYTSNGTNIDIYSSNGTNAQKFKIVPTDVGQTISGGIYTIGTAIDSSKVLDVNGASTENGANVQLYDSNNSDAQKFLFTYVGDGYYTIMNLNSGKVLDIDGASGQDGANVQQYSSNSSSAQKWMVKSDGSGHYYLISAVGTYLDVAGGGTSNGTNIDAYESNLTTSQQFTLTPVTNDSSYVLTTEISAAGNSTYVLDVPGASTDDGANIQLYTENGSNAQQYSLEITGDGYYIIRNLNSGKVLDVDGASTSNSANVQQYSYNGTSAQKWYIWKHSDGTVSFVNINSGHVLDISGANYSDGANVQQYEYNGSTAQKFYL